VSTPAPSAEAALVSAQLRREPRTPWRTAARCAWGFPTAIVSPSRLDDGTPFPTYAWLTCPFVAEHVAAEESAGATAAWAERAATDPELARALRAADTALRTARARESGGEDACAAVGLGGQRDPLGVKCLHAHAALALAGIADPIGEELLGNIEGGPACPDDRCSRLTADAESARRQPDGLAAPAAIQTNVRTAKEDQ